MGIVDRIRTAASQKGLTLAEIERALGFGNSSIRKWDQNSPSLEKVIATANFLEQSLSWLATGKKESEPLYNNLIDSYQLLPEADQERIKHFIEVCLIDIKKETTITHIHPEYEPYPVMVAEHAASYGTSKEFLAILGYVAAGKPIEGISVPMGYITPPESIDADYVLIARGNSMDPVIKDGEHIFVKNCTTLKSGDIGIFYIDGDVTCKVYQPQGNYLVLRSLNPDYEPFKFALTEQHDFKIQGKVVLTKGQIARFSE